MSNEEFLDYLGVIGLENNYSFIRKSSMNVCGLYTKMIKLKGLKSKNILVVVDRMLKLGFTPENIEYIYRYWGKITKVCECIYWESELHRLYDVIEKSNNENFIKNLNNHTSKLKGFYKIKIDNKLYTVIKDYELMDSDGKMYSDIRYISFDYVSDDYFFVKKFNEPKNNNDRLNVWILS